MQNSTLNSCKIVCLANQKGGVGKTTTAVNVAAALAAAEKRVLLIDVDPQGNTTTTFGLKEVAEYLSSYSMFMNQDSFEMLQNLVTKTFVPYLDLIPAHRRLYNIDNELSHHSDKDVRLSRSLKQFVSLYDYIILDCPPSLNSITINVMVAADYALIPVQCEYYSLEGLTQILNTIKFVSSNFNNKLKILGIVLTMLDKRNTHCRAIVEDVYKYLDDLVFATAIPRNIRVSEAASFGKPVLFFDINCPASQAYISLTKELIARTSVGIVR